MAVLAKDAQRPAARRMRALALLTRYVDHTAVLAPERADGPLQSVIVTAIHGEPVIGNAPMTSADRTRALEAIRALGRSDPDPVLRRTAELAAKGLDQRIKYRTENP